MLAMHLLALTLTYWLAPKRLRGTFVRNLFWSYARWGQWALEVYTCLLAGWVRKTHPQGGHLYWCLGHPNRCGPFQLLRVDLRYFHVEETAGLNTHMKWATLLNLKLVFTVDGAISKLRQERNASLVLFCSILFLEWERKRWCHQPISFIQNISWTTITILWSWIVVSIHLSKQA